MLEEPPPEALDSDACYRALRTRDARFDGRFFVGVTSTGIYCRPICPAGPPKRDNCRFFRSAAAAQTGGFRPCLRCRPETAPELGSWRGTSNTVSRGLALIAQGALDGEEASVAALAERLGVGERQLRRLFAQHLGASPIAVAQTRRVLFAKQLIVETRLPLSEIASVAGFGSLRRFNETFRALFARPPSALRRKLPAPVSGAAPGVSVRLYYRPPYDWAAMLAHLEARSIEGVERVSGGCYARTLEHDGQTGSVEIAHLPEQRSLAATIHFASVRALPAIVARVRRVFDLGADVTTIGAHLARDPALARAVAQRPGLRLPGAWDGFELAVRAVLGQQVSVAAARRLLGQLVRLCGVTSTAASESAGAREGLSVLFPGPERVADADLSGLPVTNARRRTLTALARAALDDATLFQRLASLEQTVARLRAIPGVGEWTAQYIALRAAEEPDAFPASDRGLLRGASSTYGSVLGAAELLARAEPWRPWRAYAAQHLWSVDAAGKA
jgi:AraC family transcriptional regulator of adaptative response / DNA-3-methyladenine glycosylase II